MMGLLRFERKSMAPEATRKNGQATGEKTYNFSVDKKQLDEHIKLLKISGLSDKWVYIIRYYVTDYLDYTNWTTDKEKTLDYLGKIKEKYNASYYRKWVYQVRKFLEYLNIEWAKQLNPPTEQEYQAKRVTTEDVQNTLTYFQGHQYYKQFKAVLLLGCTSGLRAEELYQLTTDDIDLENKTVRINHNPHNGQSTKTGKSRVSFFTDETRIALTDYFQFYKKNNSLKYLFNQCHLARNFKDAPVHVKDLRKAFSQTWDKRQGQTSIKKLLMGHSTRSDVDLMHYNGQNTEDLQKIYQTVMGDYRIQ